MLHRVLICKTFRVKQDQITPIKEQTRTNVMKFWVTRSVKRQESSKIRTMMAKLWFEVVCTPQFRPVKCSLRLKKKTEEEELCWARLGPMKSTKMEPLLLKCRKLCVIWACFIGRSKWPNSTGFFSQDSPNKMLICHAQSPQLRLISTKFWIRTLIVWKGKIVWCKLIEICSMISSNSFQIWTMLLSRWPKLQKFTNCAYWMSIWKPRCRSWKKKLQEWWHENVLRKFWITIRMISEFLSLQEKLSTLSNSHLSRFQEPNSKWISSPICFWDLKAR